MDKDNESVFHCLKKEPAVWMTREEMGNKQK